MSDIGLTVTFSNEVKENTGLEGFTFRTAEQPCPHCGKPCLVRSFEGGGFIEHRTDTLEIQCEAARAEKNAISSPVNGEEK
ncbi:MAG: hypothetical protein JKY34_11280 [Kordiimonadaceae bacterium]|nr:hypothetical protein [Kordiimonadaceae bacterium]